MLYALIIYKLKEVIKLQDIIKSDLYYKSKRRKTYNVTEFCLPVVFKQNHERSKFANKLKSVDKSIKSIKNSYSQ